MTKELLQQALRALQECRGDVISEKADDMAYNAIAALRAAIAQPEQTATSCVCARHNGFCVCAFKTAKADPTAQPVFHLREYGDVTQREMLEYIATGAISAAQPESKAAQEKRQPLTDEQIKSACGASDEYWSTAKLYCIAITRITETAHGIKA